MTSPRTNNSEQDLTRFLLTPQYLQRGPKHKLQPSLPVQQNLNRVKKSLAAQAQKQQKRAHKMRALETRTKIQLGGLIIKSGLSQLLDIVPGDDLQLDLSKRSQTHALLGVLKEAAETFEANKTSLTYFEAKGSSLANKTGKE